MGYWAPDTAKMWQTVFSGNSLLAISFLLFACEKEKARNYRIITRPILRQSLLNQQVN